MTRDGDSGRCGRGGRGGRGFTLIELTIAISILGLVSAGIVAAMIVAMRTSSEANTRLNRSGDLMLTSAFFLADAHGANTFAANNQPGFPGTRTPGCGRTASTLVVEFQGDDYEGLGTPTGLTTISYVLGPDGTELIRRSCANPSAGDVDEVSVASGLAATPSITCQSSNGSAVDCTAGSAMSVSLTTTGLDGSTHTISSARRTS